MNRAFVYFLKKNAGRPIHLYKKGVKTTDYATGATTVIYTRIKIKRAIIQEYAQKLQSNSQLPKQYSEGGFAETSKLTFTVDKKDIGSYEIQMGDYIVYLGKKWVIFEQPQVDEYLVTMNAFNTSGDTIVSGTIIKATSNDLTVSSEAGGII